MSRLSRLKYTSLSRLYAIRDNNYLGLPRRDIKRRDSLKVATVDYCPDEIDEAIIIKENKAAAESELESVKAFDLMAQQSRHLEAIEASISELSRLGGISKNDLQTITDIIEPLLDALEG